MSTACPACNSDPAQWVAIGEAPDTIIEHGLRVPARTTYEGEDIEPGAVIVICSACGSLHPDSLADRPANRLRAAAAKLRTGFTAATVSAHSYRKPIPCCRYCRSSLSHDTVHRYLEHHQEFGVASLFSVGTESIWSCNRCVRTIDDHTVESAVLKGVNCSRVFV